MTERAASWVDTPPLVLSAVVLRRACHLPPCHSHPPCALPHIPRAPLILSAVVLLRACHPPLLALLTGRYSPLILSAVVLRRPCVITPGFTQEHTLHAPPRL